MSYILDALKKAEAEQNPDIRASMALERNAQHKHRSLLILVVAALLANAAILTWLFYPTTAPLPTMHQQPLPLPVAEEPALAIVAKPTVQRNVEPTQAALNQLALNQPAAVEKKPEPAFQNPPELIPISVGALSAQQKSRFPGMVFSTHIYATDPALRALVVNGARLEEGDSFESLKLEEITESGAVFVFEQYLVSVSVVDDWE